MNDHAGWTQDLKCVLCGSDDASKPCTGLPSIEVLQNKVFPSGQQGDISSNCSIRGDNSAMDNRLVTSAWVT